MSSIIYHGDCCEIMPKLQEKFDLIITSPPYDMGFDYEGKPDYNKYSQFASQWTTHIPRLLKPHGSFWLNVGYTVIGPNQTLPLSYLYYNTMPEQLKLIQEIVWHSTNGNATPKKRFSHRTERWMWFSLDPDNTYFDLDSIREPSVTLLVRNDARGNPLGMNPTDYWLYPRTAGGIGRSRERRDWHPCQFPSAMIERIVKACCPANGRVLDPFAGTATVARVAAKRFGHEVVSIEMQREYIDYVLDEGLAVEAKLVDDQQKVVLGVAS